MGRKSSLTAINEELVTLSQWEEIAGTFHSVSEEDRTLVVHLSSGTVHYMTGSEEAKIIEQKLVGNEGKHVSILKTGLSEKPLVIQVHEGGSLIRNCTGG